MLVTGERTDYYSPAFNLNDDYINDSIADMSFQSLFSLNKDKELLASLEFPIGASTLETEPASYGVFTGESLANGGYADQKLKFVDLKAEAMLKMPKEERSSTEPFNFISTSSDPVSNLVYSPCFRQLPELQSLEQVQHEFALMESSRLKRAKSTLTRDDPYVLESIIRNFQMIPEYSVVTPAKLPQREQARRLRTTLSDKARSLEKLLPWDKKMDTATMYEEAYKYIKFLQAQVSVLQSMPNTSESFASGNSNPGYFDVPGGLRRLNRQQLLEVLVNSPMAQTILYSKGCCIYSIEQLLVLKNAECSILPSLESLSSVHHQGSALLLRIGSSIFEF